MKYTLTHVRFIMKNLRRVAHKTLEQLEPQIRKALVPNKVSTSELRRYLTKLAYDKPKQLVSMVIRGDAWPVVSERLAARDAGFLAFSEAMANIRETVAGLLAKAEADLLFKDDWGADYPEYLETELVDSIVALVSSDEEDVP